MARLPRPRKTRRSEDRVEIQALAKVLKEVRQEAGLSARGLSLQLGKVGSFIGKIEAGHHIADFITIVDIAAATGVDAGEIVNRAVAEAKQEEH